MSSENTTKNNLAACLSALLSFLILRGFIDTIYIPFKENNTGIVSTASIENISPYTNYVRFIILILVPIFIALITSSVSRKITHKYWQIITSIAQKYASFCQGNKLYTVLIVVLIFLWAINKNYGNLSWVLTDAFHEGEYLGFLPNFLDLDKPFLRSFMVHGFGLDALTSLIANKLSNHSNVIVLTRLLRMTQGLIGYLGCYWIIWELVVAINSIHSRSIFFISSLLFTTLDGIFFDYFTDVFAGRDTLFILQLALVIRFFRLANTNQLTVNEKLLIPLSIGFSLPVSFFYVYDRAAYFLVVYLFACSLSLLFGQKFFTNLLYKSIIGLVAASVLITTIVGLDQVLEVISQVLFWISYGRYISFNLLPPLSINSFPSWSRLSFAIFIQIFTILYLVSNYKKNTRLNTFLKQNFLILILLFASLTYMRIALDRPNNPNYVGSGSLISMLLLICLSLNIFKAFFDDLSQFLKPSLKCFAVIFITLIVISHPALDPVLALVKLERLYATYRVPDTKVVSPSLLQISTSLKPVVSQSACFFTLNQEGLWYYLFNQPSCSKFSVIYYARTTNAQRTVVREVDTNKPDEVLFGPTGYSNTFDGILASDAVPIIYQYFLNHYRPDIVSGSLWFWRRRDQKPAFANNEHDYYSRITTVLNPTITRNDSVALRGTTTSYQNDTVDAVYASYGDDNQLIEVAKVDNNSSWVLPIPTISLPLGQNILRIWRYSVKSDHLVQIGDDIKINLIT